MRGQPGHDTCPHVRLSPSFLGMDVTTGLTTKPSFDSPGNWIIDVPDLIFDMLSMMGVCKTRHWQTSGRLVQKLNVCTVYTPVFSFKPIHSVMNNYIRRLFNSKNNAFPQSKELSYFFKMQAAYTCHTTSVIYPPPPFFSHTFMPAFL